MHSDVGYDEKRLSLIRRIDFAWAVEKDEKKKQKKSAKESSTPWPWQTMVENLQSAQQELSVIVDLINTVSILHLELREIFQIVKFVLFREFHRDFSIIKPQIRREKKMMELN